MRSHLHGPRLRDWGALERDLWLLVAPGVYERRSWQRPCSMRTASVLAGCSRAGPTRTAIACPFNSPCGRAMGHNYGALDSRRPPPSGRVARRFDGVSPRPQDQRIGSPSGHDQATNPNLAPNRPPSTCPQNNESPAICRASGLWAYPDSNWRPLACEASALTN